MANQDGVARITKIERSKDMLKLRRKQSNRRVRSTHEIKQERRARFGKVFRLGAPWVLVLAVLGFLGGMVASGLEDGLRMELFMVDEVQIHGSKETTREEIEMALGYKPGETYLFATDPAVSEAHLKMLPWVSDARVERSMPGRLLVTITEREAHGVAFLGRLFLVDGKGKPFKEVSSDGLDTAVVTGLGTDMKALGPEDHARILGAMDIMRLYEEEGLTRFERLSEVEVDPALGYTLVTEKRGIRVLLGEGKMKARMQRLGDVLAEVDKRGIRVSSLMLDGERSLTHIPMKLAGP